MDGPSGYWQAQESWTHPVRATVSAATPASSVTRLIACFTTAVSNTEGLAPCHQRARPLLTKRADFARTAPSTACAVAAARHNSEGLNLEDELGRLLLVVPPDRQEHMTWIDAGCFVLAVVDVADR